MLHFTLQVVFFIKSVLSAYHGVGAWLFIVGSVAYTAGAAIDLKTAYYIKKGFDASRTASRNNQTVARFFVAPLQLLGYLRMHRNRCTKMQGILFDVDDEDESGSPSSANVDGSLTPHFGNLMSRRRRFETIEESINEVEDEARRTHKGLIIAVLYLISCSVGFIGGSMFFVPQVEVAFGGQNCRQVWLLVLYYFSDHFYNCFRTRYFITGATRKCK